eukprot:CAMPEP_0116017934 /NCGR_PEP_ID=MMETSP0321-20121206/8351_1 /TAXON_ID=163516 /ORGANISM="Leptocylindrus danicus var. danicus, Strain B650" /LENGTH=550 /DNA_ID=CAMNT_0003488237 /DNA_START=59 /DNA_END=1712 /DNA_ORIENTATION=+
MDDGSSSILYDLIKERNSIESPPALVSLQNLYDALQIVADSLEANAKIVRLASSLDNKGNLSKIEVKLRDKIQLLQDQLNEKLEKEVEASANYVRATNELSKLKDRAIANSAEIDRLREENKRAENNVAAMSSRLKMAEHTASIAEKHYVAFKDEMATLQKENIDLKAENTQLVNRLVSEKEKMMAQFNTMNEMNEKLQKEISLLRSMAKADREKLNNHNDGDNNITNSGDQRIKGGRMWGSGGVIVPSTPKHVLNAHTNEITSIRYDPDCTNLVATASSDSTVKIWDTGSGKVRATLRGSSGQPMLGVDFCSDMVIGCSSDKTCRVWKSKTERMVHQLAGHASKVTCCRFLPGAKEVLTGSADRSFRVWDIDRTTYKNTLTFRHGSSSTCVDTSSDSLTAVSGHLDGGLRFWDLRSGDRMAEITDLHENGVTSVMCSPTDGTKLLTNGRDSILKIVDIRMCDSIQSFSDTDFRTTFNWSASTYSPDGNYVAAGSGTSGKVFVWNVVKNKLEKKLEAHGAGVESVAWGRGGSNGQQFSSVDKDGTLVLWA